MLPLMMLNPLDLGTFTTEPNSADLLPQDALEPTVAFADILQVGLQPLSQMAADNGRPVPLAGNGLPPVAASEPGTAGAAQQRALPLPVIGQISIEGRPGVGLVEPGATPLADGRLPALPTAAPAETLPRGPATSEPLQAPTTQRLPADNLLQQHQPAQQETAARVAADAERIGLQHTTRPQPAPETGVLRPTQESAAAAARADLAEAVLGRTQGRGPLAESMASGGANRDSQPVPLPRTDAVQPGITREIRQPAPVAPSGQPAQIPVESLNQAESPLPQGPGAAQASPSAPTQLAQAPVSFNGTATTTASPQAQAPIDVPVKDTAWGGMLGERVVVMANNQLQNAEIRLTPAELGPLRVQVAVEDGAANVTFHAQHAVTREAIEQALPRLRELLAENGLTLNQADVGEQAGPDVQQGNREAAGDGAIGDGAFAEADEESAAESVQARERSRSRTDALVDTFA